MKSLFEKNNPAGIRTSQITKQEGVRSTLQRRARRKTFREKGEGRGKERRSTTDLRKRIRFVECQLEEGSLSHDLNTGGITVN